MIPRSGEHFTDPNLPNHQLRNNTNATLTSHRLISKTYTNLQLLKAPQIYNSKPQYVHPAVLSVYPAPCIFLLQLFHLNLSSFFHHPFLKAVYCFHLKYKQCFSTILDKTFISHVHIPKIMLQSFNSHNIYKYSLQPSTLDTLPKSCHSLWYKNTTCSYSSSRVILGKITRKFCWRHKYLLCQYSLMKYSATTTLQQKNYFTFRNSHIDLRNLGSQGWVVIIQVHVIQRKSVTLHLATYSWHSSCWIPWVSWFNSLGRHQAKVGCECSSDGVMEGPFSYRTGELDITHETTVSWSPAFRDLEIMKMRLAKHWLNNQSWSKP